MAFGSWPFGTAPMIPTEDPAERARKLTCAISIQLRPRTKGLSVMLESSGEAARAVRKYTAHLRVGSCKANG